MNLDEVKRQFVEQVKKFARGEAGIETHDDFCLGKQLSKHRHDATQQRAHAATLGAAARAQARKEEMLLCLIVDREKPEQRQVARRIVVAVEVAEGLLAVRLVLAAIEVDRDLARAPMTARELLDDCTLESSAHGNNRASAMRSLETRERRLGSQAALGVAGSPARQLEQRVITDARRIIAVRVTHGDRKNALAHHLGHAVCDALRAPTILQLSREQVAQAKLAIDRRQQRQAAIRTLPRRAERDYDRLGRKSFEQNGLLAIVGHAGEVR